MNGVAADLEHERGSLAQGDARVSGDIEGAPAPERFP
jgi:hypothetical protein